jgi:hypothetical protein
LLAFQEDVGSFGTLLYAGKDWKIANSTTVDDPDGRASHAARHRHLGSRHAAE